MPQPIKDPAWQFQHSVQCNAPRKFAWSYWTNIANWNDPPATFALDGPFDVGSRLTTTLPGQTWHSIIRACKADREATIEMQLSDAILSFHWQFEELPQNRTRITQRLVLSGPNAKSFVAQVSIFEQTAPDGMKKLAAAIERAHHVNRAER
ncbi:MAG: hypothetical protein WBB89_14115 [Candidatus Acidiferrum sp.]